MHSPATPVINWQAIETIFLDMDGTLLDLNFDNQFWLHYVPKKYAILHALTLEQSIAKLYPIFKQMEGTMHWYCVDYWSERLQLDIEYLKKELSHLIKMHPHVDTFLARLQKTNIHTILLTNAHRKSINIKLDKIPLHRLLDQVICAHDIGKPKEHPAFWQTLQQVLPFNKNNTLLFDDSLNVLTSAKKYGIKYLCHMSSPDSQQADKPSKHFQSIKNFSYLSNFQTEEKMRDTNE